MGTLKPYQVQVSHVGDIGPVLEFVVTEVDEVTLRNIAGFAAYVRFWNGSNTPHKVRQAEVDSVNSIIRYQLRGDEFTAEGSCFYEWVAFNPNADNGAIGRGFYRTSGAGTDGKPIERRVLA